MLIFGRLPVEKSSCPAVRKMFTSEGERLEKYYKAWKGDSDVFILLC